MRQYFSLQNQLIILLLPAVFLLSIIFPFVFFEIIGQSMEEVLLNEAKLQIERDSQDVQLFLSAKRDLVFALRDLPPIQGILRATPTGYDEQQTSSKEQWIDRLTTILTAFIEADESIIHIRMLDEYGQELVHVYASGSSVIPAQVDNLQNKSHRPYYIEGMKLTAGEYYTSPLDLNREFGRIEEPFAPVVRLAVPYFDAQNKVKGVIVMNIDANVLLNIITPSDFVDFYVTNQDGYFLKHLDPRKEFGFEFDNTDAVLENEFPSIGKDIESSIDGSMHSPALLRQVFWRRVQVNEDQYWTFIHMVDRDTLVGPVKRIRSIVIATSMFTALLLTILVVYIARRVTLPIRTLTSEANIVASGGNALQDITNFPTNEIGQLAKAMQYMHTKLRESTEVLERKVVERTEELQKTLEKQRRTNEAMMNIMDDVESAKKNLEAEIRNTQKFQMAVDRSSDAIVITDAERAILYVNPAWAQLNGYSSEEVLGKSIDIIQSFETSAEEREALSKAVHEEQQYQTEGVINKRKNGSVYNAELVIYPITAEGQLVFWVGLQRDITQRKREDAAKKEFISLASHQLRTPLTTIKWVFDMFSKGKAGELTAFQQELINDAQTCARHMAESIGTMLTLSRIEAGKVHVKIRECSPCSLAEEMLDEQKLVAEEKNILTSVECTDRDATLQTDEALFREILRNLASNAIKYSPAGGKVHIRVLQQGQNIQIDVSDTGMGIPKHQQEKVFSKFFRADNAIESETEGTGLGLYLVHSLTKLLGGSISFSSDEGKGTTFSIILPLTHPDHEQ